MFSLPAGGLENDSSQLTFCRLSGVGPELPVAMSGAPLVVSPMHSLRSAWAVSIPVDVQSRPFSVSATVICRDPIVTSAELKPGSWASRQAALNSHAVSAAPTWRYNPDKI